MCIFRITEEEYESSASKFASVLFDYGFEVNEESGRLFVVGCLILDNYRSFNDDTLKEEDSSYIDICKALLLIRDSFNKGISISKADDKNDSILIANKKSLGALRTSLEEKILAGRRMPEWEWAKVIRTQEQRRTTKTTEQICEEYRLVGMGKKDSQELFEVAHYIAEEEGWTWDNLNNCFECFDSLSDDELKGIIEYQTSELNIRYNKWIVRSKPLGLYRQYVKAIETEFGGKLEAFSKTDKCNFIGAVLDCFGVLDEYESWNKNKGSEKIQGKARYDNKTFKTIEYLMDKNSEGLDSRLMFDEWKAFDSKHLEDARLKMQVALDMKQRNQIVSEFVKQCHQQE